MHLWSIRKLKEQLRAGPLSARQALPYLLIWTWLTVLGMYLSLYASSVEDPAPWTTWDTLSILGGVLVPIATVILFYLANGGAQGADLVTRFVAVGLVVTLRVAAIGLPLVVAATGWWLFGPGVQSAEWTAVDEAVLLAGGLVLEVVIMWRTVEHGRDLWDHAGATNHALGARVA